MSFKPTDELDVPCATAWWFATVAGSRGAGSSTTCRREMVPAPHAVTPVAEPAPESVRP